MSVTIRKLTDINLLSFVFFDNVHSMLNLGIQIINDTIFFVDFVDFLSRNIYGFYKYPRSWVETILEVTLIVKSYDLLVSLREFLVDSIPIIEALSPLSNVILSDSPTVKHSIFKFAFINEFLLLVHFAISIKFRVSQFPLINELILKRVNLTVSSNKRKGRCWRLT